MRQRPDRSPSLFAAIGIGISCMIGSGVLFSAYYAAKFAGGISILSWIIGSALALLIAFMLAEISTMYHQRGLFARLLSFSHHRDFGFVFAVSVWLGVVLTMTSESVATIQYLSSVYPSWKPYLFHQDNLTMLGTSGVILLIILYGVFNYWGMQLLSKTNNLMAILKLAVPIIIGLLLLMTSFHKTNFTAYHHSIAPYGFGHAFSAVITCGIFYAFYGFSSIATFGSELKNPRRNIPIALVASVFICLLLYLLLQVAFIGALPPAMVMKGWHNLNFTSPLAELLIILQLNIGAYVLYAYAVVSPSGTGITYTGTATRMFTGMARDRQMPKFFDRVHKLYRLSRPSLFVTLAISIIVVLFFKNWQKVAVLTSVFYALSCLSVPICFAKLRISQPDKERPFRMPFGHIVSVVLFLLLSYLLIQVKGATILSALILHIILFAIYSFSFYQASGRKMLKAALSSWSIFAYLILTTLFSYLRGAGYLANYWLLLLFFVIMLILYFCLIGQRCFTCDEGAVTKAS